MGGRAPDSIVRSIGDMLKGDSSKGGLRHVSSGGASYTVKTTADPKFPGGKFVSVTDSAGRKRTIVYDKSASVVKDSGWE